MHIFIGQSKNQITANSQYKLLGHPELIFSYLRAHISSLNCQTSTVILYNTRHKRSTKGALPPCFSYLYQPLPKIQEILIQREQNKDNPVQELDLQRLNYLPSVFYIKGPSYVKTTFGTFQRSDQLLKSLKGGLRIRHFLYGSYTINLEPEVNTAIINQRFNDIWNIQMFPLTFEERN